MAQAYHLLLSFSHVYVIFRIRCVYLPFTMPPRAFIFIADGTEETEAVTTADILVRGGLDVSLIGVGPLKEGSKIATCSRGVKLVVDSLIDSVSQWETVDLLVVPGGAKGAETCSHNEQVLSALSKHWKAGKVTGMICAGSLCALRAKLFPDGGNDKAKLKITSHPSVKDELKESYDYKEEGVVVDGHLITR